MSDLNQEMRAAYEKATVFGDSRWQTWIKAWQGALASHDARTVVELQALCAQAYELISELAREAGRFGDPDVMSLLDSLFQHKSAHPGGRPLRTSTGLTATSQDTIASPMSGDRPLEIAAKRYGSAGKQAPISATTSAPNPADVTEENMRSEANAEVASTAQTDSGGAKAPASAEQERDSERIDWLEAFHKMPNGPSNAYGDVGLNLITRTDNGWLLNKELGGTRHERLRVAIDTAIQENKWILR